MAEKNCWPFPLLGNVQGDAISIDVGLLEQGAVGASTTGRFSHLTQQQASTNGSPRREESAARNSWLRTQICFPVRCDGGHALLGVILKCFSTEAHVSHRVHEFFTSAEKFVHLRKFPVVLNSKYSVCVYAQSLRQHIAKLEVHGKCRVPRGETTALRVRWEWFRRAFATGAAFLHAKGATERWMNVDFRALLAAKTRTRILKPSSCAVVDGATFVERFK